MGLRRLSSNGGSLLVPPVGGSVRMAELGPLLPQDVLLEGSNWKESSVDIAIAGECQKAYCSNHLWQQQYPRLGSGDQSVCSVSSLACQSYLSVLHASHVVSLWHDV